MNRFTVAGSILTLLVLSCSLESYAESNDRATSDELSSIEKHFFTFSRNSDSIEHRLERIEVLVYGCVQNKSVEQRLAQIQEVLGRADSKVLHGRLEEVNSNQASFPGGITLKGLQTMKPLFDKRATPLLKGSIASYPPDWLGQWGGKLILQRKFLADSSLNEGFKLGSPGLIVLTFYKRGEAIALVPTNVQFPRVLTPISQLAFSKEAEAFIRGKKPDDRMLANVEIHLRNDEPHKTIYDVTVETTVLKSTLTLLQPDVIEQNIVTRDILISQRTKTVVINVNEIVLRLTRKGDGLLLGQLASLEYNNRGQVLKNLYAQGWFTPNWRTCAAEIEKVTGETVSDLGFDELCPGMGQIPKKKQ